MNGDTLDDSGNHTAECARCGKTVTPRQWFNCPHDGDCCMNWPPGPDSHRTTAHDITPTVDAPSIVQPVATVPTPVPVHTSRCPNDTNNDGDCASCRGKPGGCPVRKVPATSQRP